MDVCRTCSSMVPRAMEPMDLKRVHEPSCKQCVACKKENHVPQPDQIPEVLRRLKPCMLHALRPLDIDTGVFQRAKYGYRIHSSMVRFAWAPRPVLEKIDDLERHKDKRRAKKAFDFLMRSKKSSYGERGLCGKRSCCKRTFNNCPTL